jgi:hypothetical protein
MPLACVARRSSRIPKIETTPSPFCVPGSRACRAGGTRPKDQRGYPGSIPSVMLVAPQRMQAAKPASSRRVKTPALRAPAAHPVRGRRVEGWSLCRKPSTSLG